MELGYTRCRLRVGERALCRRRARSDSSEIPMCARWLKPKGANRTAEPHGAPDLPRPQVYLRFLPSRPKGKSSDSCIRCSRDQVSLNIARLYRSVVAGFQITFIGCLTSREWPFNSLDDMSSETS